MYLLFYVYCSHLDLITKRESERFLNSVFLNIGMYNQTLLFPLSPYTSTCHCKMQVRVGQLVRAALAFSFNQTRRRGLNNGDEITFLFEHHGIVKTFSRGTITYGTFSLH